MNNRNGKWLLTLLFAMAILTMTACGNAQKEQPETKNDAPPEPIDVQIAIKPESLNPGDTVTIEAKVTQGEEPVEDADEVEFELWRDGDADDEHKMIEGKHAGDGIYTIEQTLDDAGVYYVIAHVTARGMHNMPQKEFHVGEVKDEGGHSGHDHGNDGVQIHFMPEKQIKADKETTLTAHVHKDGEPLAHARVRYELWKSGNEQHQFFDTEEGAKGEYSSPAIFRTPGDYHVIVHVEKGSIHEHKEHTIKVEP